MDKLAAGFGLHKQQREGFAIEVYSSLPHVLLRCLDVCQAPRVDAEQLASIIRMDAVLVARLFSLADFSKTDAQSSVSLLAQVLEQLGLNTVTAVIKTAALRQVFQTSDSSRLFFLKLLWEHALHTALSAGVIAQRTGYHNEEEAYLAGLMHDIGHIALEDKHGIKYMGFFAEKNQAGSEMNTQLDTELLEAQVFGGSHTQLGSDLISQWAWSSFVADAVKYHHAPLEAVENAHDLVKIVYLANCLAAKNDQLSMKSGRDLFGLSKQELAKIQILVEEQVATFAERIDLEPIAEGAKKPGLDLSSQLEQWEKQPLQALAEKDLKKQLLLTSKIFDIGLIDQVSGLFNDTTDNTLYLSVLNAVNVLFGLKQGMFLLYDETSGFVRSYSQGKTAVRGSLSVPMEEGRSLIANALARNEITSSFSASTYSPAESSSDYDREKIIDLQIARFFEKPGIVCLPLVDLLKVEARKIGVLVFGIDEQQFLQLQQQQNLVYGFLQESAGTISAYQLKQYQEAEDLSNELVNYQAKIRSMVHEANNPLTIVQQYLALLKNKLPDAAAVDLENEISVLKEEVQRTANILAATQEIKAAAIDAEGCEVNQVIENLFAVFEQSIMKPNAIELQLELDDQLPVLAIDIDKLKQVLSNLLKNSAEELINFNPGADKTETDKSISAYQKTLKVMTRDQVVVNGGHYIEIIIEDNGRGIPDSVMQQLFLPVHSTKGNNHQGLGLSIVRGLIEEMEGFISCKTHAGEGTLFQVLLPRKLRKP